mgnify:CR=1 FL=1
MQELRRRKRVCPCLYARQFRRAVPEGGAHSQQPVGNDPVALNTGGRKDGSQRLASACQQFRRRPSGYRDHLRPATGEQ